MKGGKGKVGAEKVYDWARVLGAPTSHGIINRRLRGIYAQAHHV